MSEIVTWDARAVQGSVRVVAQIQDTDLGKPTPCASWTLADLLTHMTGQHYGFAAAAEGDGADLGRWQPSPPTGAASDLVDEYTLAADRVIAAFAAEGVLDRPFSLPEISTRIQFPAEKAIGFHLVDYVVHGWDVARSLGLGYEVEPIVLDAALAIAQAVPDGESRRRPGAAFAPRREPVGDGPLDRVLTLLGRDPAWPLVSATRE
jgi:uncharacterized protein (TIGR03086 family)